MQSQSINLAFKTSFLFLAKAIKFFSPIIVTGIALNSHAFANQTITAPSAQINQTQRIVPAQSLPAKFEVNFLTQAVDVGQLNNIPTPQIQLTDVDIIPTVLIPVSQINTTNQFDISLIDDFIRQTSANARHYPTNFINRTARYNAKELLISLEDSIRPLAEAPDASYDVLIRAAMLNGMARNLDLGSDYAMRASNYVAKAIERRPDSAEANFLYGMLLSEGGGFKEGKKYLDRAAAQGYLEAEQSLAQTDLMTDNREGALSRLQRLQLQYPSNSLLQEQLRIAQSGGYYIWDLPADKYPKNYPVLGQ